MINFPLPRIDNDNELREMFLPYCRIKEGEIYTDPHSGHRIGCIDSSVMGQVLQLTGGEKIQLGILDPPYNFVAFEERNIARFIDWCRKWVDISYNILKDNSSFYVWLGADQNNHYQPLPQFMQMMEASGFDSRSFITMRNQRGYGTQKNWMAIRQELLYYIKGEPEFNIQAEYTDIPKVLRGYYKNISGTETENLERSKSTNIRAGNVWIDIQQVFYRMEENVSGCYAQKPIKSINRIISASSNRGDIVLDLFAHSGTTLLSSEILERKCFTADCDPVFCEISLRRLEHFRNSGKLGWQNSNPFREEILSDSKIKEHLKKKYNYSFEETKTAWNY